MSDFCLYFYTIELYLCIFHCYCIFDIKSWGLEVQHVLFQSSVQKTEQNSPLDLEVQLHITEAVCHAVTEPVFAAYGALRHVADLRAGDVVVVKGIGGVYSRLQKHLGLQK